MEKKNGKIIVEPLSPKDFTKVLTDIDEEMKRKHISFTREEAVRDDLYD